MYNDIIDFIAMMFKARRDYYVWNTKCAKKSVPGHY